MRLIRGVFGGTFDPVHQGHVALGRWLVQTECFDQIHYIVNHRPPHRQVPVVTSAHRMAMLQLALADDPSLIADDREICRDDTSYTVDTLIAVRSELDAATPVALILGSDVLMSMTSWRNWQELPGLAHLVALDRPDTPLPEEASKTLGLPVVATLKQLMTKPAGSLWFARQPQIQASATEARNRLNQKQSMTGLLSSSVAQYIHDHALY